MQNSSLTDILQFILTDGIGPVSFYKAVQKAGSLQEALRLLQAGGTKKICSRSRAEDEIAQAQKAGIRLIAYTDDIYPENLRNIPDAPPILYAKGNTELLRRPLATAVVGARNASISGRKVASRIAYDLTENDVLVISGMARGIDAAAHKGALYAKNKSGATIAVLGTGADIVYPPENEDLYHSICEQGLVLSEMPIGTAAFVSNFPRRNRIISALSAGVLIVEAGLHSGSLITARQALEQGKEIFAVPGSPMETRSQGPNYLIKQGAILTENAEDIINVLQISHNRQIKNYQMDLLPLDKAENNVNILEDDVEITPQQPTHTDFLQFISYEGVDIDELLRTSNLPTDKFFATLLDLELEGKIERQVGNKVARIK